MKKDKNWEPKIIAYVCNWCTYSGADLAGTTRLHYPPFVKLIRVTCSGRIDPHFILKTFETGADAVWISGCHPGDCHYSAGNYHARRKFLLFLELLKFMGIPEDRLLFTWISAAEAKKFADTATAFIEKIKKLGPFTDFHKLIEKSNAKLIF